MATKIWTVYKHTSPSGKVYIGITSKSPYVRWSLRYKNNRYFTAAIEKYGWDNITHELLSQNLTKDEAINYEISLIAEWKEKNLCYNLTNGGEGYLGLQHSEEFKQRVRQRSLGNTWGAKPCTNETKKKIGKSNGKEVVQIDINTNKIINKFESCHDVSRQLKVSFQSISRACLKNNKAHGYYWKYL